MPNKKISAQLAAGTRSKQIFDTLPQQQENKPIHRKTRSSTFSKERQSKKRSTSKCAEVKENKPTIIVVSKKLNVHHKVRVDSVDSRKSRSSQGLVQLNAYGSVISTKSGKSRSKSKEKLRNRKEHKSENVPDILNRITNLEKRQNNIIKAVN